METRLMRAPTLAMSMFVLCTANPRSGLCQNDQGHRNDCPVSENLKIKKSVQGTYTEEATRKNVEGTAVLCLTVDGHGKVTDVSPISGPEQLLQLSMNAARQWEFEPPSKAPAQQPRRHRVSVH
jgi:TonB family protein